MYIIYTLYISLSISGFESKHQPLELRSPRPRRGERLKKFRASSVRGDTYIMTWTLHVDTCGYMKHVDIRRYTMWIHYVDICGFCGCKRLIWIPCIIYAYSWGSPHTSRQAGRVRGQSSAWRALFECQKGTDLVTAFDDY